MRRLISRIALGIAVLVAAVALWARHVITTPAYHTRAGQYIKIPKGSSPVTVIKKLKSEGIIKHEWPLLLYLKLTGAGSRFKAGEYDFASPISPFAVIAKLQHGEQRLVRLTIVEGWTRWDIAEAMAGVPELGLQDSQTALALMSDVSLIRDLDLDADNLEGYLYPATYEFPPNTTPAELIGLMVEQFRSVWKPDWSARAAALGMSARQVVTVASLIETEAKLPAERPLIASVIYNRLKKDIPLGVDSSIIYGSKIDGKWRNDGKVYRSDIERRSPYNTRIHPGLPPGPIASPGESSLLAALNPAQTNYMYYVREPSRDDGAHNFYVHEKDFALGVQALRKWERERDAENAKKKSQEIHLQH
ncbi:MAG TPA: endolytic transglycosylase MltG [Pyrinomonadaceae bacterium]|nr:endolytic transglycosylase MltG [Pyrinomonadaceae bacterium]